MDTETLNKLSKFKQIVENDRVNICKQIKTDIVSRNIDKSLSLNKSGIISQILTTKKYDVGDGLNNYKGFMEKYTCFICTGKYNVKVGEFDILTDNEFKAIKMEQYYKNLKKGSSKLEEIDNTIFKGLANLYEKDPTQNQVTCKKFLVNDNGDKTGKCVDTNVYSKLNNKVIVKLKKKKLDQINENAIYLLNDKERMINSVNKYYTHITENDEGEGIQLLKKNINDLINDEKPFDEYKQYMAFIPVNKRNKFLSIMYSPGKPKDDVIIMVKMMLYSVKPPEISLTNDYTQERKKMIFDLLKIDGFTDHNEFTEGYVNYIKEYGFRK